MRVLFKIRKSTLYCRITINGSRCNSDFSINEKVNPAKWDSKNQIIKGSGAEVALQNARLEKIRARIRSIESDLSNKGRPVTSDILKKVFLGKQKTNYTFLELAKAFYEYQTSLTGIDIAPGTLGTYRSRYRNVVQFLEQSKKTAIICEEFNAAMARQFALWIKVEKKASQNYAIKNIIFVKYVLKFAMQGEYLQYDPLSVFTLKGDKPKKIVWLTKEQLGTLEDWRFAQQRLVRVRDVFVFCCYTGLSYADVSRLDASRDIKDGMIRMNRAKTEEPFVIPLRAKPKEILERYNGALPVLSNVHMNAYLKEIGAIVGLPQHLTVHVSRKTFGMLMLNAGVPMETVSRMLGHASIKVTQTSYAKVNEDRIKADMQGIV